MNLRGVCKLWRDTFDADIKHPFILLPSSTGYTPPAMRVQFPTSCDCGMERCHISNPPKVESYQIDHQPIEALIDISGSSINNVMGFVTAHSRIRLLAIAVDFTHSTEPFSLPALSMKCQNLTHLSLSEFSFPANDRDQTLDLPELNTLTLNFFCTGQSVSSDRPMVLHQSIQGWKLPRLRNLGLKGWVSDSDDAFFSCLHKLIRRVGPTLQGILYNIWRHTSTRDEIHSLPHELWLWCPHLQTVQTSFKVFFGGPDPPPSHPSITVVPVHLGNLETLPTAPHMERQVWPREVFKRIRDTNWPIERIRISTTWATFYRKLRGIYDEINIPPDQRESDPSVRYWPTYFCKWIRLLHQKGYHVEDRYGVPITSSDGPAQEVHSWLQGFDEWVLVDRLGQWGYA